jgi:hypothetical protein
MSVIENRVHPTLETLDRAVKIWMEDGDDGKLARWLGRELDADGVPIRLAVPEWPRCLEILAEARRQRGEWPSGSVGAIDGLAEAALRFARPDGRPAMHGESTDRVPPVWDSPDWMRWYRGTGIARVLGGCIGARPRGSESAPPPLPTWSATDRVLAMLRPDWRPVGDFLAVDHRDVRSPCRLELFGGGRTWLGPEWGEGVRGPGRPASRPRPSRRFASAAADLIEWSYRVEATRITRTALLLRGRRLALFSILAEGRGPAWDVEPTLRLAMPPTVAARPLRESRALVLTEPGRRGAAQVLPIALPCRPYPTDRGAFRAADSELTLGQAPAGRRCWLPLLVSWDADRHRKTLSWRVLTVSERSRAVPPDRAFAVRVSWGRDETYVIYRSLGPPARRAFLGHQTAARLLVADFTEDGDLKPFLSVE